MLRAGPKGTLDYEIDAFCFGFGGIGGPGRSGSAGGRHPGTIDVKFRKVLHFISPERKTPPIAVFSGRQDVGGSRVSARVV